MLQCFFYGTGQSDEGICVEVQIAHHRVLLDCGLRDLSVLETLQPPDLILCSHADPDNIRSILLLHQKFPDVPIYSSIVTAKLLGLGSSLSPQIQTLDWRSSTELLPNVTVQLFPAGHLPGAAIILLIDTGGDPTDDTTGDRPQTLLYAPDLSLTNSRLTDGLKLEELRGLFPDVLIISGMYGTDRYPHRRQLETQLMETIDRAIISGQSVLLPVPVLGLAQEILILLRSHHLFSGRNVTVALDDAIADQCDRYEQIIPTFPSSIQNFARYQSLFLDSTIRPCIQRLTSDPKTFAVPQIILISQPETSGQPLPALVQILMQRGDWFFLFSHTSRHQFEMPALPTESYALPNHCDGSTLPQVIHTLRPQHVVFIHGTPLKLLQLAELDDLNSRYKLHIPSSGTALELPIADFFNTPSVPDVSYEGELIETETEILISLPRDLTADPRWKVLSDLGLIRAQWQGNSLIIRGISQRDSRLS